VTEQKQAASVLLFWYIAMCGNQDIREDSW